MSESSQLSDALHCANEIPPRQFAQMLRRIAIALKGRSDSPFSDDEVQILLDQFSLGPSELESLFSACQYVLQQYACYSYDSERAAAYAEQLGLSEETAQCFSAVWDAEGDSLVDSLKQRPVTDSALDGVSWRLNLRAASKDDGATKDPTVILDFNVDGDNGIAVQFTHDELSEFYAQIEAIQQHIDKLT